MHSSIAALPCAAVSLESLLSGDEAAAAAAAESIRRHSFAVLRADSASDELEPVKAAEAGMRSFFALPHAEKEACATDASEGPKSSHVWAPAFQPQMDASRHGSCPRVATRETRIASSSTS